MPHLSPMPGLGQMDKLPDKLSGIKIPLRHDFESGKPITQASIEEGRIGSGQHCGPAVNGGGRSK